MVNFENSGHKLGKFAGFEVGDRVRFTGILDDGDVFIVVKVRTKTIKNGVKKNYYTIRSLKDTGVYLRNVAGKFLSADDYVSVDELLDKYRDYTDLYNAFGDDEYLDELKRVEEQLKKAVDNQ